MADVSALLLSLGEPTTQCAHRALLNQTVALDRIVRIEGVSPFSKAFNLGVSRISTEYFLQCDADMVLKPECVEVLLDAMACEYALVFGYLRDPLLGSVQGVKLFRTSVCRDFPLKPLAHCESQQLEDWSAAGWKFLKLTRCLGTHRTDRSNSVYNFERFRRIGFKTRVRRGWKDLTNRLTKLRKRADDPAVPSLVAAALSGAFEQRSGDILTPAVDSPGLLRWLGDGSDDFVRRQLRSDDYKDWIALAHFCKTKILDESDVVDESDFLVPWERYLAEELSTHLTSDRGCVFR